MPVEHIVLTTHAYEHKIFVPPFQRRYGTAQVWVVPRRGRRLRPLRWARDLCCASLRCRAPTCLPRGQRTAALNRCDAECGLRCIQVHPCSQLSFGRSFVHRHARQAMVLPAGPAAAAAGHLQRARAADEREGQRGRALGRRDPVREPVGVHRHRALHRGAARTCRQCAHMPSAACYHSLSASAQGSCLLCGTELKRQPWWRTCVCASVQWWSSSEDFAETCSGDCGARRAPSTTRRPGL